MPSPISDGKGQSSLTLHRYGVGVDCHSRFFQVCALIPKGTEIVNERRLWKYDGSAATDLGPALSSWGVASPAHVTSVGQDTTYFTVNFSDVQTSQSGAKTNIANDIASFLLDLPSQTGRDLNTFFPAYRQWWLFAYATDKWQATSKLTLVHQLARAPAASGWRASKSASRLCTAACVPITPLGRPVEPEV